MTGGLKTHIVPSVIIVTTVNENPTSVAVSRSSASSEANHTVRPLFVSQDDTEFPNDGDLPWVAESITNT
eukprot:7030358-Heterocapsa_arctica.AAC.1